MWLLGRGWFLGFWSWCRIFSAISRAYSPSLPLTSTGRFCWMEWRKAWISVFRGSWWLVSFHWVWWRKSWKSRSSRFCGGFGGICCIFLGQKEGARVIWLRVLCMKSIWR